MRAGETCLYAIMEDTIYDVDSYAGFVCGLPCGAKDQVKDEEPHEGTEDILDKEENDGEEQSMHLHLTGEHTVPQSMSAGEQSIYTVLAGEHLIRDQLTEEILREQWPIAESIQVRLMRELIVWPLILKAPKEIICSSSLSVLVYKSWAVPNRLMSETSRFYPICMPNNCLLEDIAKYAAMF